MCLFVRSGSVLCPYSAILSNGNPLSIFLFFGVDLIFILFVYLLFPSPLLFGVLHPYYL